MLKYLSFWSLLLLCFVSLSKERIRWAEGKIMLKTGEELKGKVCYNPKFDVISLYQKSNERIQCFSATKVSSFEYYDEEYEIVRKYVSYACSNNRNYKSIVFFEIVLTGKMMLLRRPNTLKQIPKMKREVFDETFGGYSYFVRFNDVFTNLKRFRGKILPLLEQEYGEDIAEFLETYHLSSSNRATQVQIIDFYNHLSNLGSAEHYELYTMNE